MRAEAFTHRHSGKDRKEELSQLDTSTMQEDYGLLGIIIPSDNRRAINTFQKGSDAKRRRDKEEYLSTVQKNIENAAEKIQHRTNAQKDKEVMRTPENVRLREEAAAGCAAGGGGRVLRRQARKARAGHLVRCSLVPGKKKGKRKPLTELYVKGHFTEDRAEWQKERQTHCAEVYTDIFWKKGNQKFTDATQRSQWTQFCKPEPN